MFSYSDKKKAISVGVIGLVGISVTLVLAKKLKLGGNK